MKPFKYVIIAVATLLLANDLDAQNYVDLFRVDYSISPSNTFDNSNTTTDLNEISADLNIPIVVSEKATIITGALYESFTTALFPEFPRETIHGITFKAGVNYKYNDRLSGTHVFIPRLASDLKVVDGNQFQYGLISIWKIEKDINTNYKFGFYTNSEFFGPFFVPIFGFYKQTGPWELKATLPLNADFNYSFNPKTRVGFRYDGLIKSFNLNSNNNGINEYVAKANNEIGLYLQKGFGPIHLRLFSGISVGRSLRTYQDNEKNKFTVTVFRFGDNRTQLNTDFANGFILKGGFIYRFKIPESK